jgi:sucrose phosphorylase
MSKYRNVSAESETRSAQLRRFYRRLHLSEPDFTRPTLELRPKDKKAIMDRLVFLYGDRAETCFREIVRVYYAHKHLEMIEEEKDFRPSERFTEKDVALITYGDLIRSPDRRPLRALTDFLRVFMGDAINVIHILPFFPSSSDRRFSIIDYEKVDPQLGSWEDIEVLSTMKHCFHRMMESRSPSDRTGSGGFPPERPGDECR